MHPPIFNEFKRKESISDGKSIYDFLGGAIDASYKQGWEKNVHPEHTKVKADYPSPSEWTVDWIACLLAAKLAGDSFSVIELGAGYGQWMVTSIMAYKALNPNKPAHGMALEADRTHYQWLEQHVKKNLGFYPDIHADLLHAAAGFDGTVKFPVLADPSRNYGATYQRASVDGIELQEVPCFSMKTIDQRFDEKSIDILHVDIQGAEKDLILSSGFDELMGKCRFALFGTHRSDELHCDVREAIEATGLRVLIDWPRNSQVETPFGRIKTNDGAVLAASPSLFSHCNSIIF
jgi:FkbM family methyltransferase